MSAAVIRRTGAVRQLGGRQATPQQLIDEDVNDPAKLARKLNETRKDVASLQSDHRPRRIYFEDMIAGDSGAILNLPHRMNGRVRWSVVDWVADDAATAPAPALTRDTSTDANTLALASYAAGTVTICVEEAG